MPTVCKSLWLWREGLQLFIMVTLGSANNLNANNDSDRIGTGPGNSP